jgi:hypothetical protein
MASRTPATTYTLESFIEMKVADDMTYYNFSILEINGNIQHLDRNVVEDYIPELEDLSVEIKLTDDQFRKYKYAPDLLAYDLYGSVQLDFIILLVNDMVDPKEFDRKTIKLPYASTLSKFLNSVYSGEYNYIAMNRSENNMQTRI